jgi:hypothetical protein
LYSWVGWAFQFGISLDGGGPLRQGFPPQMAKPDEPKRLSWPWWAPWALVAVAATSLLTIGATLYDIL